MHQAEPISASAKPPRKPPRKRSSAIAEGPSWEPKPYSGVTILAPTYRPAGGVSAERCGRREIRRPVDTKNSLALSIRIRPGETDTSRSATLLSSSNPCGGAQVDESEDTGLAAWVLSSA
jgi:hypothetical protein